MRQRGGNLITWVVDDIGCPGAILDDFCIRNLAGDTVGWVFGISVFSLKGEHIGWYEEGVLYDIENKVLGCIPGATGLAFACPALAPELAAPAFAKRPHVPALRGRAVRPAGRGWSSFCLSTYLSPAGLSATGVPFMARRAPLMPCGAHDLPR